jgi:type IV secretory pathway VirB10-like protein
MKATGGIGLVWFVATAVAVIIAAVAVGGVRSEVTDTPTVLGVSASPAITVLTPTVPADTPNGAADLPGTPPPTLAPVVETALPDDRVVETTTTTTSVTTTTRPPVAVQTGGTRSETEEPETTKSRPQSGTPSTTPSTPPTTTTTTMATVKPDNATETSTTAPSATSTTTKAETAYTRLVDTDGGSVAIRVTGDEVVFRRAFPSSGWRFDLVNGGPETVEVIFGKTDDRSIKILVSITVVDGTLEISIASPD